MSPAKVEEVLRSSDAPRRGEGIGAIKPQAHAG
jgi:hypothetical protein